MVPNCYRSHISRHPPHPRLSWSLREALPLESIYYVLTWLCHRTCEHCYEDRFHPYSGDPLDQVLQQSRANFAPVIANLPPRLTYIDPSDPTRQEKIGSVILAGGEVLLEPIRESVLYPAIRLLQQKYQAQGGVKIIVQTTGDLLTSKIIEELLSLNVWMISVSGIDAFHKGLETQEAQTRLQDRCTSQLLQAGFEHFPQVAENSRKAEDTGHYFHFFGATPDMWIGALWPRGRAWTNSLSTATLVDNYCNRWSGGLKFLEHRYAGSEVSIDPEGNVFPCCVKTKTPIGNLLQTPLLDILDSHRGNPIYEAISLGHPERMGLAHGWSEEKFLEQSTTRKPDGSTYQNLCIGCDAFHTQVLSPTQLVQLQRP